MSQGATPAVFLSASVPDPQRDERFYRTGDVVRIRDATEALVEAVLPVGRLVWGGHPAIGPFVKAISCRLGLPDRVITWQSKYFQGSSTAEAHALSQVRWVDAAQTLTESVNLMRDAMLTSEPFVAAVFIGGMEGVIDEHAQFGRLHPTAPRLPIGTTGGAAQILCHDHPHPDAAVAAQLEGELAYALLFEDLLIPLLAAASP